MTPERKKPLKKANPHAKNKPVPQPSHKLPQAYGTFDQRQKQQRDNDS